MAHGTNLETGGSTRVDDGAAQSVHGLVAAGMDVVVRGEDDDDNGESDAPADPR